MECFHCLHDNPDGARYCNSCGERIDPPSHDDVKRCVSCGKRMSYEVYFNVCQHCGFAYRIKISKPNGSKAVTTWKYILLYYLSLVMPGAGLVIGGAYISTPGPDRRLGKDCAVLGILNLMTVGIAVYYLGLLNAF